MNEDLHGLPQEALTMGGLILKYVKDEIDPEEKQLLDAWMVRSEKNRLFVEELLQKEVLHHRLVYYYKGEERKAAATEKMLQQVFPDEARVKKMDNRWRNTLTAAAILLSIAIGAYLWIVRNNRTQLVKTENSNEKPGADIEPGRNGAVLKLANGQEIILDSAANGLLAQQGSSNIVKIDGELTYSGSTSTAEKQEIAYNTLTTPRGRQFHVVLPDGSHIWLNAESSIHFPVVFTGSERKVEITGEAYFEVAHNASKPFIVKFLPSTGGAGGGQVEVLGTHFNVDAYNDEEVAKVTLLEGKVKIGNRQSGIGNLTSVVLTPGKQAVCTADSRFTIHEADIDAVMAWKNGSFYFNDASLETIMRQLARWYDVEVVNENKSPGIQLVGAIDRNTRLSEVLKILELSGVHFRVEGKKIIVLSK